MATFNYQKFKILLDPTSKKKQGLNIGDVVRRQYFDNPTLIYSLMIVTDIGVDVIGENETPYFVGALIEGSAPKNGELLDFVRITNLFDDNRSGALYLTASDSEAPYLDVIDGMAVEQSLCYPYMGGGEADVVDINKYTCIGATFLKTEYRTSDAEASRIFKITRNQIPSDNNILGFKQSLEKCPGHPAQLIISYKIRASKTMENVSLSFGYTNGVETDGCDLINIDSDWQYKLSIITVDYPAQYQRSFCIDLTAQLSTPGDWCEIANLNIIQQADLASFKESTKVRVGKIKGVIDPVFGILEGYGAYFQNLYASKNINIAGTLIAGDANGFSSTFYVGKIHKNVILNSIACEFSDSNIIVTSSPVGIGNVYQIGIDTLLNVQSCEWREAHVGKKYCFSLWVKGEAGDISVFQNEHPIQDIKISSEEWKRYHITFVIKSSTQDRLTIRLSGQANNLLVTAPQLEAGTRPTQYQPTDEKLNYTEEYGAWFNQGGVGGTIQNPLLKLNTDGSISSNNNSFVIFKDGSGHLSNGAITWNEKEVILQENVILKWGNLDKETQENLKGDSAYSINSTLTNYLYKANSLGIIITNQSATTRIYAYKGNQNVEFNIGDLPDVDGMTLTKNETLKTITFSVSEYTDSLADSGSIEIPIIVDDIEFKISFAWSKAMTGVSGNESETLDWIVDWNKNKTQINGDSVITPKIFSGIQNEDETVSGVAIGHFDLKTKNLNGAIVTTTINGISGYKNGYKTFCIDNNSGFIGGWSIDMDSIYTGIKNNTPKCFTSSKEAVTIGNHGIRGYKWFLDSSGNVQLGDGEEYIKYDSNSGKILFGSQVSLNWIGATYIDESGIFTGTLSSNVVNTLQLNADQITAGTINTALIDVESLKASLITANNIEALTLNVVKGKIGGWNIDTDSMYRGAKNNTVGTYTSASGAVTIGNNGIRGFKWRLDGTGAGAVAGGNISWDASGSVSFGPSVVLNWTVPINSITVALGGSSYPKLTQISGTGIYTGTLTAAQINAVSIDAGSIKAGTLSADRIAANSINGNKIVARTISADRIITGTITANEIASKTITAAKITAGTITATEINVSNIQASVVTAGVVNGLTCTFVRGTIGGWTINTSQIYKGNVYLSSDGTISNSTKWILRNDGSGQLASGAIAWNTAGAVTFSSAVSLNWTNAATNALNSAKSYADTKKNEAISSAATDATNKTNSAKELASAMAYGKMLYRDPTFYKGNNNTNVYNNSGNGTVSITRVNDNNAPNDSKYVLLIKNTGAASPDCGGFHFSTTTSFRKILITRIIAKIPVGRNINYHSNSIGTGGQQKWLTPTAGTGDWCEYVCKVVCGTSNFSSTNFFALTGNTGTTSSPIEWRVAYATVFDITSTEKYTTTIDSEGIYTSSINANQITAGVINADRIAANSLNGNKIVARTITADRIIAGAISSTEIASNAISADKISARAITAAKIAVGTITANEIAGRTITSVEIKAGTITANEIATKTITASCIATGTITANEINTNSLRANIVTAEAVNGLTCTFEKGKIGGFEILGWKLLAYDNDNGNGIKHYVEIHNTGYICNARTSDNKDFWALNRDGSADFGLGKIHFGADGDGWFANKNISWTTSGNITMTGTITATAGRIAGFNISGNSLVNSTSTASIILNNLAGQSFVRINESTSSPLLGIRTDVSNRTGLSISTYASGATGLYIINNVGGAGAIKSYGSHTFGQRSGETWNAPGVLYIGSKYNAGQNSSYKKIFGDGVSITSSTHLGGSKYKFNHNLGHSEYTVFAQTISTQAYYGSYRLLERTSTYFVIQNVGSSGGADNAPFDFIVYGRNKI